MCQTMDRDMHSLPVLFLLLPAALGFLLAVIFLRRIIKWRISSKVPPGSMSLPLIGETISLLKPCSVTSLGDFMKQRLTRYGNIFSSNFMGRPTIISADADLNEFVLKNEWRLFTPGKLLARDGLLGKWSISIVDQADTYKRMRSSLVEFFSGGRIRTLFLEDADRLSSLVIDSWREGSTIYAYQEAVKFALYISAKNISSITPDDVRMGILKTEFHKYVLGIACLPIYIPGSTYWKAIQSREKLLNMFKTEMEIRVEKGYSTREERMEEADDLLTRLMKKEFSDDQIGDLMLGVLVAGYDTTSKAISTLIYFLHGCPKAIMQLRDEHLRIAKAKEERGDGKLTWEDYKDMDFTKCVINETLRLTNVAALLVKNAKKDVEFKGYIIPQGWNVILHLTAVHLDPSNYDDPEQFNPWRWQSSAAGTSNRNRLMPFGAGVRLCPGAELARLEMAVFLHHLILKYDWEPVEPDPPMRTPFTKFHKGLPIRIRAAACTDPFLE